MCVFYLANQLVQTNLLENFWMCFDFSMWGKKNVCHNNCLYIASRHDDHWNPSWDTDNIIENLVKQIDAVGSIGKDVVQRSRELNKKNDCL